MTKDKKQKIIDIFEQILSFHKTLGKKGNIQTKYRIQSYEKVIKNLKKYKGPITQISNIENMEGVGKGFQSKIQEIINTNSLSLYQNIQKNKTYQSISLFEKIWGVGVEKAREIVLKYHIYSIPQLKKAIKKNPLLLNEQQKLGLTYFDELQKRIPRKNITDFTKYLSTLFHKKYKINIENAGSYRLGKKDSGDIDLIFSIPDFQYLSSYAKFEFIDNILDDLKNKDILLHILSKGSQKCILIIQNPITHQIHQMDILFIDKHELPWYLLYFGSSKEFSKKIRQEAKQKGYKLSEKGLFSLSNQKKINIQPKNEKDIFQFLHIPYIPPHKRI
jgi:DNA polymerase/3'-5' exonuclease PolX